MLLHKYSGPMSGTPLDKSTQCPGTWPQRGQADSLRRARGDPLAAPAATGCPPGPRAACDAN
eukprot:15098279-Alexandrium_andersonii.AAC.1